MSNLVVCVDASVTLKLVLPEEDSDLAQMLWSWWQKKQAVVIAPALWGYEVTSTLRKNAYRGLIPAEKEEVLFERLHDLPVRLMAPAGLHRRASELARRFDRPAAYDAHYLALAEMVGCSFWTADKRLYNRVHAELSWVNWLGNLADIS